MGRFVTLYGTYRENQMVQDVKIVISPLHLLHVAKRGWLSVEERALNIWGNSDV